eukprot:4336540-Amphidinium_carterae.1
MVFKGRSSPGILQIRTSESRQHGATIPKKNAKFSTLSLTARPREARDIEEFDSGIQWHGVEEHCTRRLQRST